MLKNLDCLEYLKTLDSKSVDLVLVDPPYFGIVNNEWDNQWPTELEYLEWCEQWTKECARVLKDNRMLVVWGTLKTDTFLNYKLNVLNKIDSLKSQTEIIWHYNWGGRTKSNFGRKSELAWCYSKGDTFLFNADDVRVERTITSDMNKGKKLLEEYKNKFEKEHGEKPNKEQIKNYRKEHIDPVIKFPKGTIPTNVWQFQNHTASKEHCGWHPTTKNLDVLERIIKAYTNTDDTVLDCFSGSGSTMIASARAGRKFTGCELDKDYYEKSKERFENLVPMADRFSLDNE